MKSLSEEDAFMADVAGRLAGGERGLSAESWIRMEPDGEASVLAELSNGSPALVAGRRGKGRVVLCAAGGHVAAGSSWPLRPAFVVLVRGLVQSLAAADVAAAPARGLREGLAAAIPGEMGGGAPGAFALAMSAGTAAYTPLAWFRRGDRLLLPPPEKPGHYLLSIQPTASPDGLQQPGLGAVMTPMAVNPSPQESVFTPLTEAEIRQRWAGASVDISDAARFSLDELSSGREIWRLLAIAALAFIGIEGLVAWRSVSGASPRA